MTTFTEADPADIAMIARALRGLLPARRPLFEPAFASRLIVAHSFASAVPTPNTAPAADRARDARPPGVAGHLLQERS